jgi:hypothetical protein
MLLARRIRYNYIKALNKHRDGQYAREVANTVGGNHMYSSFCKFVIVIVLVLATGVIWATEYEFKTDQTIYVFGDVHGAYQELELALKNSGLIDDQANWQGGQSTLVSLGDLMDRGPVSRRTMDLLMKLQKQAFQAGGQLHVLLGNHEVMNLIGDLRYVSREEYAEFSSEELTSIRTTAFEKYLRLTKSIINEESRSAFSKQFPAGYFARKSAMAPEGRYGQWLMSLPFVIKVNDHVFVHGGIADSVADLDIKSVNEKYHRLLRDYLETWSVIDADNNLDLHVPFLERDVYVEQLLNARNAVENLTLSPANQKSTDVLNYFLSLSEDLARSKNSPFWYRGHILCHPYYETENLRQVLHSWEATKLWVGHTPSQAVELFHGGLLVAHDAGMLTSYYGGRAYVSRIEPGGQHRIIDGTDGTIGNAPLPRTNLKFETYGMSDDALEEYLETATVLKVEQLGKGITRPKLIFLEKDGVEKLAVFKYLDTHRGRLKKRLSAKNARPDRYQHEVAAYKLDRMLGIGRVPVTVLRHIHGKEGSLQIWIDDLASANYIVEKQIPYDGFCDLRGQENMRNIFDYLIHNFDRNDSNIHFSLADWKVWFIDHSRAFRSVTTKPKLMKHTTLTLTPEFRQALNNLTDEQLDSLREYLTKGQIKAIKRRKEKLLNDEVN